jgi:hypothetical protein
MEANYTGLVIFGILIVALIIAFIVVKIKLKL